MALCVAYVVLVESVVIRDGLGGRVSIVAVGYLQVPREAVQALAVFVAQVHERQMVVSQRPHQTVHMTLEPHNTGRSHREHWEITQRTL